MEVGVATGGVVVEVRKVGQLCRGGHRRRPVGAATGSDRPEFVDPHCRVQPTRPCVVLDAERDKLNAGQRRVSPNNIGMPRFSRDRCFDRHVRVGVQLQSGNLAEIDLVRVPPFKEGDPILVVVQGIPAEAEAGKDLRRLSRNRLPIELAGAVKEEPDLLVVEDVEGAGAHPYRATRLATLQITHRQRKGLLVLLHAVDLVELRRHAGRERVEVGRPAVILDVDKGDIELRVDRRIADRQVDIPPLRADQVHLRNPDVCQRR